MSRACLMIAASIAILGAASFFLMGAPPSAAPSGRTVYDATKGRVRWRAIVVPPAMLEKAGMESLAREALSGTPLALLDVLVGTSEADLKTSILRTYPKPESESNYSDSIAQLARAGGSVFSPRVGRILAVNGSALVSIREAGRGQITRSGVSEEVLGKDNVDPTIFRVQNARYRLLTFDAPEVRYLGFPLTVFFKVYKSRPSCTACQELATHFARTTGASAVHVEIRPDVWFASSGFPLVFLFEPDNLPVTYSELQGYVTPPTVEDYYRQDRLACDWNSLPRDRFTCNGYGMYDHVP